MHFYNCQFRDQAALAGSRILNGKLFNTFYMILEMHIFQYLNTVQATCVGLVMSP